MHLAHLTKAPKIILQGYHPWEMPWGNGVWRCYFALAALDLLFYCIFLVTFIFSLLFMCHVIPTMPTPAPDQNTFSKSPFYLARHLWYAALWSCLSATPSLQTMLSQSRMRTASFTFKRFKVFTCIFCPLWQFLVLKID